MEHVVLNWIILNKSIHLYKEFLNKRIHKNLSYVEFAKNQLAIFENHKEIEKTNNIIKYNIKTELPYEYNILYQDCLTFLKGKEDYKALVFPILLGKDEIFDFNNLLKILQEEEEKQDAIFLKNLLNNTDIDDN